MRHAEVNHSIFVDECGYNMRTARSHGPARLGERAYRQVCGQRGRNVNARTTYIRLYCSFQGTNSLFNNIEKRTVIQVQMNDRAEARRQGLALGNYRTQLLLQALQRNIGTISVAKCGQWFRFMQIITNMHQ